MPIYSYEHPDTGEIFDDIRPFKKANKPFIAPDGKKCKRIFSIKNVRGWRGDREPFEADPDYVKSQKPKYIRFNDGHRERYDPTRHC